MLNMNLSIKLSVTNKTVNFFSKGLTSDTQITTCQCLDIIHFGMSFTLISFDDEYYKYSGG